ncbi:MAG: methylmalonyl Co-A mutase-associated GTPase MeaB [Calditrichaeota bacterium]|nr:MAG: methylmalonyl Co-A mutase-associated GTPase MeaB [Calditrichota bacterium]
MPGVAGCHDGLKSGEMHETTTNKSIKKRQPLKTEDYVSGILARDRTTLARAITIIESNSVKHQKQAQTLLTELMPHTGNSIRIGITGVPGAGKSTLIEAFGLYLIEQGHSVAVLAIDPSSSITGGSILGDKTRMEKLANKPAGFIRPSPTSGALGGVARKTRETMLICEAAGFDIILVETVGVGQSEITVRSMVDFFLLLQIAGGGDELQGIKKGVMEIADAVLVNKADGDNKPKAEAAKQDYAMALHYMPQHTIGWQTKAFTCSAVTGEGIAELWQVIEKFKTITRDNRTFAARRRSQSREWMRAMVEEYLQSIFYKNEAILHALPQIENAVMAGKMPATTAAQKLVDIYEKKV